VEVVPTNVRNKDGSVTILKFGTRTLKKVPNTRRKNV